jgi:riboflavin synthase
MFTGLIEEMGVIAALRPQKDAVELEIQCRESLKGTALGDSIAIDGICFTVTRSTHAAFSTFASAETLRRTNLVFKGVGDRVNLERPLTLEKRLGGHMVQGHVDGVGTVHSIKREGEAQMWRFTLSPELAKLLVPKGSVAVDGISLTVVDAQRDFFSVAIIPKTITATTFQFRKPGDVVNIETDVIGKYVYKFLHPEESMKVAEPPSFTLDLLHSKGISSRTGTE